MWTCFRKTTLPKPATQLAPGTEARAFIREFFLLSHFLFVRFVHNKKCRFFPDNSKVKMKHKAKGTVSFVNCGYDMFGSQFLITLDDNLDYLDGKHLVFGQVSEGLEVLDALNEEPTNDKYEPLRDIR